MDGGICCELAASSRENLAPNHDKRSATKLRNLPVRGISGIVVQINWKNLAQTSVPFPCLRSLDQLGRYVID